MTKGLKRKISAKTGMGSYRSRQAVPRLAVRIFVQELYSPWSSSGPFIAAHSVIRRKTKLSI